MRNYFEFVLVVQKMFKDISTSSSGGELVQRKTDHINSPRAMGIGKQCGPYEQSHKNLYSGPQIRDHI